MRLRVVSWNLDSSAKGKLDDKIELLRQLSPDLAFLQELNRPVYKALLPQPEAHERMHQRRRVFAWGTLSTDHTDPRGSDVRVGCAVLGSPATMLLSAKLLHSAQFDVSAPERSALLRRTMAAQVATHGGRTLTACSLHARPAPSDPVRQPPTFHSGVAGWLADLAGTAVIGICAHAPQVDHPDFAESRFRRPAPAGGGPGEDQLLGPQAIHGLTDVLRTHLHRHPDDLQRIRADRPNGPLAVSYHEDGEPMRYDHIWATPDLEVFDVRYLYDEAVATGSDHGLVLADFEV